MSLKTVSPAVAVSQNVRRPNDIDQYAIGDVVDTDPGAGLTFSNVVRGEGMAGSIIDGVLRSNANQATDGDFELWLFDTALAAYDADNDKFTPTDDDIINLIGILQFATPFEANAGAGQGGAIIYQAAKTFLPLRFATTATSTDLFGVLVVRNTYTPIGFERFTVTLKIEQD